MKVRTKILQTEKAEKTGKLNPIPVRLSLEQDSDLRALSEKSGIPKSAIMRMGLEYFLPRALKGEINLLTCGRKG